MFDEDVYLGTVATRLHDTGDGEKYAVRVHFHDLNIQHGFLLDMDDLPGVNKRRQAMLTALERAFGALGLGCVELNTYWSSEARARVVVRVYDAEAVV